MPENQTNKKPLETLKNIYISEIFKEILRGKFQPSCVSGHFVSNILSTTNNLKLFFVRIYIYIFRTTLCIKINIHHMTG